MKIIAKNRRAFFDYEITDRLVAGLVLAGHEVKSIRAGHISLKGSFVHFTNHEAYLVNSHIRKYSHAGAIADYDPTRSRKLLLKQSEIEHLQAAKRGTSMAIVPLAVGLERGRVKLEIGLGRGKKRFDKREVARKKAAERDNALERKVRKIT
jgi:SsrA-binding protein